MLTILLTNDDGIEASGLRALEAAARNLGDVWTVAPEIEHSACGRSVSLHRPLRVHARSPRRFSVDGTPTDCVLLAFRELIREKIDVVLSGINSGYNLGEDVDYSGTVAAAAEGALQGATVAMAISSQVRCSDDSYPLVADRALRLLDLAIADPPPVNTFLNVNIPPSGTSAVRITRQGDFRGPGDVLVADDPRGRRYYWIGNRPDDHEAPPDTDCGALHQGLISVSLLTLDRSFRNGGGWAGTLGGEFCLV